MFDTAMYQHATEISRINHFLVINEKRNWELTFPPLNHTNMLNVYLWIKGGKKIHFVKLTVPNPDRNFPHYD